MRIFVVLICSLALVCVAYGAQPEQGKPQKKKQAQTAQHGAPPTGHPTGAGAGGKKTSMGGYQGKNGKGSMEAYRGQTGTKSQTSVQSEGHRPGQGQTTAAFRKSPSKLHDQGRVHNPYRNNIVFVFGAPYYWNAGYWFPAWGYSPNAYYAWDGPIYAYHHLPPDQVIANVQATLQQQGYYHGDVDGLVGPLTRAALADYQRDHGLYETAAIDQPTLESLGMS